MRNRIVGWLADPTDAEARLIAMREVASSQALAYFDGNPPRLLKVDPKTQIDDNIFVNYPEMIVDKGVDFLFSDGLKISINNPKAEAALEELWPDERRAEDLQELGTDGGIFGDAWIKIRIGDTGKPEIVILDPSIWYKITDPDNFKKIQLYRCQYKRSDGRYYREEIRLDWVFPASGGQAAQRWLIQEFESIDGKKWLAVGPEIVWPWSFPPVMVCKNLPKSKSAYGRPDLTKSVLELCKYIARTDSLIGKIVRVHSSPKAVAKGLSAQDLQVGVDSTIFLKNLDSTLELLEMTGDLAGALAFRALLRQALSEISKVPEIASGNLDKIGQLSGRAMSILYSPLIKQTLKKRKSYGPLITDTVRGILIAGGVVNEVAAAALKIELKWPSPVPPDPTEEAELGEIYKRLGVSTETILQKLGFDPEEELKKIKAEQKDKDERQAKLFNAGAVPGAELYMN